MTSSEILACIAAYCEANLGAGGADDRDEPTETVKVNYTATGTTNEDLGKEDEPYEDVLTSINLF